jgi:hypothetical protein
VEANTATIPQVPAAYSDFGPAGVSSAWAVSGVGTQDVAMAARQAKARKAMDHPRLFTNEDLARLNQGGGMQTGVSSSIVTNPSTMPGSDINAQPQQNVQPQAQQPQAQQNNATQPRSPFQPKTQAPQSPQSPK